MSVKKKQAHEIAQMISDTCEGQSTAEMMMAIGMIIGGMEALAKHPDTDETFRLLRRVAEHEFAARVAEGQCAAEPTPTPSEMHNRIAGWLVGEIIRPIFRSGGTSQQVLVLLESVIAGTLFALVRFGGDEPVLDTLMENVRARLAELRLGGMQPEGRA